MVIFGLCSILIDVLFCLGIAIPLVFLDNLIAIIIGFIFFTAGALGTLISRYAYLKKSWSSLIKVFPEKNMIYHGPYRIIRHPIYFCALFFFTGSFLVFPTFMNIVFIILLLAGYITLTKVEDDFLRKNLDFYQKYAQTVRFRLLPGIW
jgi:protein-S-isoprenylcysteine O-methyltransferase Ste14